MASPPSIRTLLVVGITGSGKSTLCNSLAQIDPEDLSKAFRESSSSASETQKFKSMEIGQWKLVDTVGLGDTSASPGTVYRDIAEACNECAKTGISQILLVTRGRVTQEQLTAFETIGTVLLDENMWAYTTVIRTGFPGFMHNAKCATDIEQMKSKHPALAKLLPMIGNRVVHVDNQDSDANDQWQVKRAQSRQKVFDHLTKVTHRRLSYMPPNLEKIKKRIEEDLQRIHESEQMAATLQEQKAKIEELEREGKASQEDLRQLKELQEKSKIAQAEAEKLQQALVDKMQNDRGVFVHIGRAMDNACRNFQDTVERNCVIQ